MHFDTVLIIGILAGILQFFGYAIYFFDVMRSGVRPNPASWLIWSYGNALICASYIFLNTDISVAGDILPIVCGAACIVMTMLFFLFGKFRPLETFEKIIVGIDILITIVWVLSDFVGLRLVPLTALHIVLLISTCVSFFPLYLEVVRDHEAEKARAWIVWSVAYVLLLFVVIAEQGKAESFLYPFLYLALHAAVAIFASRRLRPVREALINKLRHI